MTQTQSDLKMIFHPGHRLPFQLIPPLITVYVEVIQYVQHLSDRHWLHHHLPVHPVRPYTHVFHHGSSAEYGEIQPAEI